MNRICKGIMFYLSVVILSAVILVAAAKIIFSVSPFVVLSGSMEPAIKVGSICFIDERDRDVEKGDIIAFRTSGDMMVTHRVVEIRDDGTFITKGDNNEERDLSPVRKEQIAGTELFSVPAAGYPIMWIKSREGAVLLITVLTAFALIEVIRILYPERSSARCGREEERN